MPERGRKFFDKPWIDAPSAIGAADLITRNALDFGELGRVASGFRDLRSKTTRTDEPDASAFRLISDVRVAPGTSRPVVFPARADFDRYDRTCLEGAGGLEFR